MKKKTIINIVIQTRAKFCLRFTKIDTKLFFSGAPILPLISSVGPSPKIKKLSWLLSV